MSVSRRDLIDAGAEVDPVLGAEGAILREKSVSTYAMSSPCRCVRDPCRLRRRRSRPRDRRRSRRARCRPIACRPQRPRGCGRVPGRRRCCCTHERRTRPSADPGPLRPTVRATPPPCRRRAVGRLRSPTHCYVRVVARSGIRAAHLAPREPFAATIDPPERPCVGDHVGIDARLVGDVEDVALLAPVGRDTDLAGRSNRGAGPAELIEVAEACGARKRRRRALRRPPWASGADDHLTTPSRCMLRRARSRNAVQAGLRISLHT